MSPLCLQTFHESMEKVGVGEKWGDRKEVSHMLQWWQRGDSDILLALEGGLQRPAIVHRGRVGWSLIRTLPQLCLPKARAQVSMMSCGLCPRATGIHG